MLRREKGERGKGKGKSTSKRESVLLETECIQNEGSEHKVERSGSGQSLMAKDMRRNAKESNDKSRIKKEKRNIRKRSKYVLKQLSVQ